MAVWLGGAYVAVSDCRKRAAGLCIVVDQMDALLPRTYADDASTDICNETRKMVR